MTGKGGVGKTTVAAALGLLAARSGRRTIVAEIGAQAHVAASFGAASPGFHEVELAPGLSTISIDPEHAIEEYLHVKAGRLADVLIRSRAFSYLAQATPGLRELVSLGKVWELAQLERRTRGGSPYDLVVFDAPATGHGVGVLKTPSTFAEIARVGPIATQGRAMAASLADPSFTGVLAVARAEEMPVTETLELRDALQRELGLALDRVVVNAVLPARFTAREAAALRAAAKGANGSAAARAALAAALSAHGRASGQRAQIRRLRAGLGGAPVELPFLFSSVLDAAALDTLARVLEAKL